MSNSSSPIDHPGGNTFSIGRSPPIDPNLINELEKQAYGIANDLETMLQNLQSQMFEASVLTSASFDVYKQAILSHGAALEDASSKTRELIEMCVRLDKELANVQTMASNIKNIRQQVDTLHAAIGK
ncbi:13985_t:CDS:2 [Acaulospora colombiana]|uniref:13985_t:CDS:1 n=1 Tax=Acaulospora colombiana TaxID=27376 RepID=A0ACA9KGD1_9GLOM|nr:13985_t:CDS:2 [Acaulospora colombiana]